MIRIDTDRVTLEVKGKLTELYMFQFVLVQVRPAPDPRIDDVRESLPASHLQSAIECTLDGDALGVMRSVGRDCGDERIQFIPLFFQLLYQGLDGSFGEPFGLSALAMAHQRMDDTEAGVR